MILDLLLFLILITIFYILSHSYQAYPEVYYTKKPIYTHCLDEENHPTKARTKTTLNRQLGAVESFNSTRQIGKIYHPKAGSPHSRTRGYYRILDEEPFIEYAI